ncbi:hypothetical protein ACOQFL_04365 [Actinopolyspora sp. H202]|uniref:hypothetical protein n=1 Tax=Actinopolyspora sp. H202 TaxID=1500456 RepID=UPI003EE5DC12
MPVIRTGRWSRWRGTLPLPALVKRRPGNTHLPRRAAETNTPTTLAPPDPQLLARILTGLRAL